MVPEEWGAGGWVGAHAVEEVRGVLIQAVVDHDCFVLGVLFFVLVCGEEVFVYRVVGWRIEPG